MKRIMRFSAMLASMTIGLLSTTAQASDAATSAQTGSGFGRPGSAAATARYAGDVGFARTNTRSGEVNLARGVAVGFDEGGLSLSLSNAIALRNGSAIATNFNLSIDRDGSVATSGGSAVSNGGIERSASAGGSTSTGRDGAIAASIASGRSDRFGTVRAETRSNESGPRWSDGRRVIHVR